MSDAQYHHAQHHPNHLSVNPQQQKRKDRQCGSRYRNTQQTGGKIPHGFFAPEIPEPPDLIQHHQRHSAHQPPGPGRPRMPVEIPKHQRRAGDPCLPHPLKGQQDAVFSGGVVVFWLVFCPKQVGDKQGQQTHQPHIGKSKMSHRVSALGLQPVFAPVGLGGQGNGQLHHVLHLLLQQPGGRRRLSLRALHDELIVDLEHQPGL